MRDSAHYRKMFAGSPGVNVGFRLVACAIYAARHGRCEPEHHGTDEWRTIAREIKGVYGEAVPSEMALGLLDGERRLRGKHVLLDIPGRSAMLTTDHPASCEGVPVFVLDGVGYEPDDVVDIHGPEQTAAVATRGVRSVIDPDEPISDEDAEALRGAWDAACGEA